MTPTALRDELAAAHWPVTLILNSGESIVVESVFDIAVKEGHPAAIVYSDGHRYAVSVMNVAAVRTAEAEPGPSN